MEFGRELRFAIRDLGRAPGYALVAICTLAVAIGAGTAVFSVVDTVLVRPLSIDEPDRVVVMWTRERLDAGSISEFSYPAFRSWQRDTRVFETLAAIGSVNWNLVLREGEPTTLPVAAVSASFFPLIGTPAALGRTLLPIDDERGAERVAVMSHGTWVRRFAADPAVVGRPLRFDDAVYTIVGVMPDGFDYPKGAELWVPLVPQIAPTNDRPGVDLLVDTGIGFLFVLGRLNAGITIDAARHEVASVGAQNRDLIPAQYYAVLTPLDEYIFGTMRPALIALAVCVGLVLLIACANVAVLLLARAAARIHDTATRLAIGATRWRIVRQSLTDALLLSTLASGVALALAYWAVELLVAIAPSDVPRLDAISFDARTFAFAGVVCLVATVLIGAAPALQISRWNVANILGHDSLRVVRSHRLRRAFLVAQVALAIVLLVCGGLVARSFVNLLRVDIGFEPLNVLTLDVTVPDVPVNRYNRFYTALLARVRSMPDVASAGAIHLRPLAFTAIGSDVRIVIEGQRADVAGDWERNPPVNFESVTPGYFQAMGTRILRGRDFTDTDTDRAPLVALASAGLAQRLWPGQDPIGRLVLPSGAPTDAQGVPQWSTVVGIVEDARYRGLTDPRFDLYVPYLQRPDHAVKHLMVRTRRGALSLVDPIAAEARRLEPTALVENVATMDQLVGRAVAPWRFSASMLGLPPQPPCARARLAGCVCSCEPVSPGADARDWGARRGGCAPAPDCEPCAS